MADNAQGRDIWMQDALAKQSTDCPVEWMDAEATLFRVRVIGNHCNPLAPPEPSSLLVVLVRVR